MHLLGGGSNVLVRDEGVDGLVIRIAGDAFSAIEVSDNTLTCGAGAMLSQAITTAVKHGLAGLESLVGIPGTIGGALRGNAGGRGGDIGRFVSQVTVLTAKGEIATRTDELTFSYRKSSLNEPVILDCQLKLQPEDAEKITQRMKQTWIMKKATQPLSHQSAGCIFKNPRGMSAGALIEQAGLKGTRIGGAEFSDRHANFLVTDQQTKSADVQALILKAQQAIAEQFGVDLETEIQIW
ncbi:UNVERIFIED_CONTAM: hypothetical protein GTU68_062419 [Idotea baltica]|nr:hypothetical protein [Idotea baltica]